MNQIIKPFSYGYTVIDYNGDAIKATAFSSSDEINLLIRVSKDKVEQYKGMAGYLWRWCKERGLEQSTECLYLKSQIKSLYTQIHTIPFYLSGLFSKHGFHDGDILDDLLIEYDIAPNAWWFDGQFSDNHPYTFKHCLLITLLENYVIPSITPDKLPLYRIVTCHNPLRMQDTNQSKELHDKIINVEPSFILLTIKKMTDKNCDF